MSDLETRTRSALQQFDNNMAGIFDRSQFYDGDLYSTKNSDPTLNKSQKCFKYTLLAANLLFLIFGVVLMSVGSYAMNNSFSFVQGQTLPAGLIVLGVFIMLLALLGAGAAWRESRGFLGLYFVLLMIFTIILFAVGIAVYVEQDKIGDVVRSAWMNNYNTNAGAQTLFTVAAAFDCNGADKLCDYPFMQASYTTGNGTNSQQCGNIAASQGWTQGCVAPLTSYINGGLNTAGGCGIAFAVIMFIGMGFVFVLMQGIKRKRLEADLAALRQSNNTGDMEMGQVL